MDLAARARLCHGAGMAPDVFNSTILAPALTWFAGLVPSVPVEATARVLLLAIAGQESGWQDVQQGGGGPGMGPWQFETETCLEILNNAATKDAALAVCKALEVVPSEVGVYRQLLAQPNLACAFARLDLWANPRPLPAVGDHHDAWVYYLATWRPGRPGPDRWPGNYQAAMTALQLT